MVFTENYPRTSIDVYIEVLQANAGTRCAGATTASVALASGIPMRDLVPSVAVRKVNDQIVLDLQKRRTASDGRPASGYHPADRRGHPDADGRYLTRRSSTARSRWASGPARRSTRSEDALAEIRHREDVDRRACRRTASGGLKMSRAILSESRDPSTSTGQGKRVDGRAWDEFRPISAPAILRHGGRLLRGRQH
jgi:hypothetical protein